jgi:hypothetical protein
VTASDTARSGYKAYLKAIGKTKAELLTMAAAVESGIEETIITSLSGDGTGTGAQVSDLPKTARLAVIMEVYAEGNAPRSLCAVVDRSLYASPV